MKRTYKIPVTFEMYGTMKIEAESLDEAKRIALEEAPLPDEKYYVDDSCELNEEVLSADPLYYSQS